MSYISVNLLKLHFLIFNFLFLFSYTAKVDIKCRSCEEQFSSIESYIQHQKVHFPQDSKEKGKLLCNVCPYSSVIKDNIRKHLFRHYDVKPFKCRFCEWSCVTKHQLNVHHRNNHLNLKRSRYDR